ncbi:MAG: barstar family protein [Pseudomonadota bacterium]
MNALAQQLSQFETAGSYTLTCGVDSLRQASAQAGLMLFEADMKGVKGKPKLLGALARAIDCPDTFGANWDALADVLCDLSWQGATPGYVLLLRNASDTLGLSVNDREIAQDLFADTALYWRQRGKPFWIFFA